MKMTRIIFIIILFLSCKERTKQLYDNGTKNSDSQSAQLVYQNEKIDTFSLFWDEFKKVIFDKNYSSLQKMSFDTLECEHEFVLFEQFSNTLFDKLFDDTLKQKISIEKKVEVHKSTIDSKYVREHILKQLSMPVPMMTQVDILKQEGASVEGLVVVLNFWETAAGYKFYGYDIFGR